MIRQRIAMESLRSPWAYGYFGHRLRCFIVDFSLPSIPCRKCTTFLTASFTPPTLSSLRTHTRMLVAVSSHKFLSRKESAPWLFEPLEFVSQRLPAPA